MRKYIFIFFLGVVATAIGYYFRQQTPAVETPVVQRAEPRSVSRMPSFLMSYSNPQNVNEETIEALKARMKERFLKAGLDEAKAKAMFDLNDFHQTQPAFNEENIIKREAMLEELSRDPKSTTQAFQKLIAEATPDEEALRSFLINITLALKLDDQEKAQIFTARIQKGAVFRADGTVEDNELSLMLALTHLVRLEDEKAKEFALDEIRGARPGPELEVIIKEFFPTEKSTP